MKEVHVATWWRRDNGQLEHRHGAITDATGAYRITADVIVRDSEDVLTEMPLEVPAAGLDEVIVAIASGVTLHGRIRFAGTAPVRVVPRKSRTLTLTLHPQ